MPVAIRGDLAQWVEDKADTLVRAFTSDDDGVIVAADEGGVVDAPGTGGGVGGDGDDVSDASDASGGAPDDAASDMFDYRASPQSTLREESSGSALKIVRAFWEGKPLM